MNEAIPRYRCPLHGIPDCSVLLNGCNLPNLLRAAWNDGYAAADYDRAQARADAAEKALAPVLALADEWERLADAADTGTFAKRERWVGAMRARAKEVRAAVASHQEGGA